MALRHLHLRDFVIVPSLELSLASGFTALTGETGAGKSILIDALQLVLGERGDALWVREGQPRCEIGAEFDVPPDTRPWLLDNGFVETDAETLLLRRTIDAAGRSRAWINGSPATLAQLRELGQRLVDIHGQHAWQSLTRPASVRALLDAYAGLDTQPLAAAWQAWRQAESALKDARAAQDTLAQEQQRLAWQIGELDKLAPLDGEWEELNQRHARLSHAQALIDGAQSASAALEGDDGHGGALPALARAQQALEQQRDIEPEFAALLDVLEGCVAQARDVAHSLHGYLRRAEPDPEALATLDERLGQWIALARRYRRQPQDLFATLAEWRAELARLDSATDLASLEAACQTTHAQYQEAAQGVSRQRAQAAPRLANSVTAAMQKLGMPGSRFEVALEPLAEAAQHGLENVIFQVAAHAGSAPRAIERVASGGELSRLALAIAVTTSELGSVGTLVFDEVDSGVGGAVAATVGRLLHQLGRDRQVLCVTHLPQVAACADAHLQVSKRAADNGAPISDLQALAGEARIGEIARMLGGERISDTTLAHALEMLKPAEPTTGAAARTPRKARS